MKLAILDSKSGTPVVHEWDCRTIRPNVNGDLKAVAGNGDHEILAPLREPVATTPEQIDRSARYRRCEICCPDVPDSTWTKPTVKWMDVSAGNLRPAHIGKHFRDIGTLEAITFGDGFVHCVGSDASLMCTTAGTLSYRRPA